MSGRASSSAYHGRPLAFPRRTPVRGDAETNSAQHPNEAREKARGAVKKAHTKWESLTPEQQATLKSTWKAEGDAAKAKWQAMTPEQQQQAISQAKTKAMAAAKQWEALPADQKDAMKATWKADSAQAKAKWQAMTPEQRQQAIAGLKTKVQATQPTAPAPAAQPTAPAPATQPAAPKQ